MKLNKLWRAGLFALGAIAIVAQVGPVVITTPSPLPFAVQGQSYNTVLQATGGSSGFYSWFLDSGTLPAGLFVESGGAITSGGSGIVTGAPAIYTFTIRANSTPTDGLKTFQLQVYSRVQVTSTSVPAAARNTPYSTQLTATGGSGGPYVWQLSDSDLPPGLVLNSAGQVSGTPTGPAGDYVFFVTATDTVGQESARTGVSIRINEQALVINPPSTLERGVINVPYTNALTATGGNGTYLWVIQSGGTGLPSGITLTSAGQLIGTPTVSGPFTFRARVSDSSTFQPQAQSADFSLFINPLLVISTTGLPGGVVGTPYNAQLTATGGQQPPLTWTLLSGTLPNGLTLSTSGAITGTPTVASTFNFVVQVVDAGVGQGRQVRTQAFSIAVAPAPLVIVTTALGQATAFVPYSQAITAAGGDPPYTWSLASGTLPTGITFSSAGVLSGTTTQVGNHPITVRVRDNGDPSQETTRNFTLVVDPGNPFITTESLPPAQAQTQYSQILAASGGTAPYRFTLGSGSLPSGFILTEQGVILGSAPSATSSSFSVVVTDQRGRTGQRSFVLSVSPRDPASDKLEIATTALPDATVGISYGMQLAARNGQPPYTWAISGLPAGLTGNFHGEIQGTPTQAGTFSVQVVVSDDAGARATGSLNLIVKGGTIVITTERAPDGRVNESYSATFAATGGVAPYTFGLGGGTAPSGLTMSPAGVLSGTPTEIGTFTFTVQARDANGATGTRDYSVVIAPARLTITTSSLGNGSVNVAYSSGLAAAGGRPPYQWSVSGLPDGLSADASTGAITGTPSRPGSFSVSARVTDRDNQTASRDFAIEIASGLTITTTSVGPFAVGVAASSSLAAAGGRPPYSWTVTGGSLPGGLSLGSDGAITGTPTALGAFSFTAQVRDQNNQTATRTFSGTVVTPLTITTTTAPAGSLQAAYSFSLAAAGGTPPYRWSTTGNLPPGVTVSSDGSVSGTPTATGTFSFTAIVTDAATPPQTTQRGFTITVDLPQLSGVTLVLPPNPQPQQQTNVGVTIDRAFPTDISGTLTLTFAPNTANNADDPFILFSTGGRVAPFTIRAGETQAVFNVPNVAIQTGTTAGTITVTTALTSAGNPVSCNCDLTRTLVIPRGVPVITNVRLQRSGASFTVTVTGFSPSREVSQGTFRFAGSNLQTTELAVPLGPAFTSWFTSTPSQQFGSQFTLTLPFNTQGDASTVTSVTVILTNTAGNSQPVSANF